MRWYPGATTTQCCLESSGRPSVGKPTGRGEGVSSWMTNARKPGDRLQRFSRRSTRTCMSPPVENPGYTAFKEYGKVPETVPLNFTEDDVTWVAPKISDAAGALGAEAIETINWLLHFGCVSEELRVVVDRLADSMTTLPPPPDCLLRTNGILPSGA